MGVRWELRTICRSGRSKDRGYHVAQIMMGVTLKQGRGRSKDGDYNIIAEEG